MGCAHAVLGSIAIRQHARKLTEFSVIYIVLTITFKDLAILRFCFRFAIILRTGCCLFQEIWSSCIRGRDTPLFAGSHDYTMDPSRSFTIRARLRF